MKRLCFAVLLLGCGAATPNGAPPAPSSTSAPPPAEANCDGARGIQCFERRRATCTPESKSWRLAFTLMASQHELYVSDLGIIRTDAPQATLFSHDGATWLACLDGCPPGGAKRACIPYLAHSRISADPPEGCTAEEKDGLAWHGYRTRVSRWTCKDGRTVEVVSVPELAEVRDALVEVAFIQRDSGLAKRDGLAVAVRVDGMPEFFEVRAVEQVGCSVWDYPEGYAVYADPERFDRLAEIGGPLQAAVDLSLRKQSAEIERAFNDRLIAEIGRRCLGERDRYEETEVQQCVKDKPAIHPEVEALRRTAADKLTSVIMQNGQERARLELSHALCSELAK